jgi:hypothetical protein
VWTSALPPLCHHHQSDASESSDNDNGNSDEDWEPLTKQIEADDEAEVSLRVMGVGGVWLGWWGG